MANQKVRAKDQFVEAVSPYIFNNSLSELREKVIHNKDTYELNNESFTKEQLVEAYNYAKWEITNEDGLKELSNIIWISIAGLVLTFLTHEQQLALTLLIFSTLYICYLLIVVIKSMINKTVWTLITLIVLALSYLSILFQIIPSGYKYFNNIITTTSSQYITFDTFLRQHQAQSSAIQNQIMYLGIAIIMVASLALRNKANKKSELYHKILILIDVLTKS